MKPSLRCKWCLVVIAGLLIAKPVFAQVATDELDERIVEVNELVRQLRKTKEIDQSTRWARYLTKSVDRLREMQKVSAKLKVSSSKGAPPTKAILAKQADKLQRRIDSDEEFVEMTRRIIKAVKEDREEDVDDLTVEIKEFLVELESLGELKTQSKATAHSSRLASGEYFITQSWSQQRDFKRPYYVSIPEQTGAEKLPVLIFLHGNGGNAKQAMKGFTRRRKRIASSFVMVFPQGYRESWNIISERSKADDLGFIEAIVHKLAAHENVERNNFTIMGNSNGAALVNQLAIESKLPHVCNYISGVSPLNVWQHDGDHFKAKGDDNNYKAVAEPAKGKRLLNISGTEDHLVPYHGGLSKVIPAKDGKLAFVDAEKSTFLWAKQMGYEGELLSKPTKIDGALHYFSYLDGDVVHIKVTNEGHGAGGGISEDVILGFLRDKKAQD